MRLILIFLAALSCLEGKIIQTNKLADALAFLDRSSWLLLDLDDTLLEGENQLGRAKWYNYEIQKLMRQGADCEIAQKSFYPQWILSQILCPVRTVEPNSAGVVAKAQEMAQCVMGLTSRHPPIASLSVEQLQKLHIDLSKTAPTLPIGFEWGETLYRNGIWFITGFLSKGETFARMLAAVSNPPKRVICVDDGRLHLEEMEKALQPLQIEFIGIHYTKAQERPFNPQVAEMQYSHLPEVLSDAEAALMIHP